MPSSAGLRDRSHNPAGVQMEHVPGAPRQSPAHQQCLTGEIHTGQQTVRAEPVAERLLVQSQRDRSRHELSYFIAGPRIQVQVVPATQPIQAPRAPITILLSRTDDRRALEGGIGGPAIR